MLQGTHIQSTALAALLFLTTSCQPAHEQNPTITLSVIGTNDVHGSLLSVDGNRGLALFAGYVNNLRETRANDGGAVLLIDAGDMWQGTIESNFSEGASVVAAFNALGYDAAPLQPVAKPALPGVRMGDGAKSGRPTQIR